MSYDKFLQEMESLKPVMNDFQKLSDIVQNKITELSPEEPTSRFFHYTSAPGLEGIITSANIWATDYRFLNDSREMKDGVEIVCKELLKSDEQIFQQLAEYLTEHSDNLAEHITPHIISFCSTSDLLSQWRAYANQSEGYCVEFDLSDSRLSTYQNDTVVISHFLPVIYDDQIKVKIINDIITEIIKTIFAHKLDNINFENLSPEKKGVLTGLLHNVFMLPLLTFKDKGFSEEKEWRAIFLPNSVQNEKLIKFRTLGGTFIPYIESLFLQSDDDNLFQRETMPIKSICLPPAAGKTTRKGLELFLKNNGFIDENKINVIDSVIPLRNQKTINW